MAPLGAAALCADAQYWGGYGRCIVKGYRRKYTNGLDALDLQVHRFTKMRLSVCHPFSALFYCLYVCVLYAFVPHLFNQHTDNLFSLRAASIDRLMLYTWPAVYKKKVGNDAQSGREH